MGEYADLTDWVRTRAAELSLQECIAQILSGELPIVPALQRQRDFEARLKVLEEKVNG